MLEDAGAGCGASTEAVDRLWKAARLPVERLRLGISVEKAGDAVAMAEAGVAEGGCVVLCARGSS